MTGDIQIYIISHSLKDIEKIESDDVYIPLFVGCNGKNNCGFLSDDIGENISNKNEFFCELTGLYWMWKNSDAKILGLVHYRRVFSKKVFSDRLNLEDLDKFLKDYDIIVPKKVRAVNKNVYEDYKISHFSKDLDLCENIIKELFPDYLSNFKRVMDSNKFYCCNMLITKKEIVDEYCEWLFSILTEVEKKIDIADYDNYQKRVYGFLAERLFTVWLDKQDFRIKEMHVKIFGLRAKLNSFYPVRYVFTKLNNFF